MDEINLSEAVVIPWLLDIENTDDVLVIEIPQELHLTECSQTEHAMVKWCDFLDSNLLS